MHYNSGYFSSLLFLAINFAVYLFFILKAYEGHYRHKPLPTALLVSGFVVVSTVVIMLFLLDSAPLARYQYPVLFLWVTGTMIMSRVILRSKLPQLLFLVFVVLDVQFNIMRTAEIITQLGLFPRLFTSPDLQFLSIHSLVLLTFLPFLWYLFIRLFKEVIDRNIDVIYWKYLFVIPISAYLYCVFSSFNHTFKSGIQGVVELFILLLLNLLSFLSYIIALQMLIKTQDSLLAKESAAISRQMLLIQNEQYQKLAENTGAVQRIQHDLRHHFIALKGFLDSADLTGANEYLENSIGKELTKEENPICEHHAVDLILRHYIALAKADGVLVHTAVQLPAAFKMPDAELCVIFGNLAENAAEACRRQTSGGKFISIKAKLIHANTLVLTVTNSYEKTITQCGDGFLSQKHDGMGIGTASIKSIVERNGGSCKFTFTDNIFTASVLLTP